MKRRNRLVATVEPSAGAGGRKSDWSVTLRAPDGRFVGLVVGTPGFVVDATRAALAGGVQALRAFPERGYADG